MYKKARSFLAALTAAVMLCSCSASGSSSKGSGDSSESSSQQTTTAATVTLPQDSSSAAEESSSDGGEQQESSITPLMWKVTAENGNELTLIGSMHTLKEDCYPLPKRITDEYDKADTVVCELDLYNFSNDLELQLKFMNGVTYDSKDETAADHLSAETYDNVARYLDKNGYDPDVLSHYKVWVLSSECENILCENAGFDVKKGFDLHILECAHNDGKKIVEAEGMDKQIEMLSSFPDELYDLMLAPYSPENEQNLLDSANRIYEVWKAGEIEDTNAYVGQEYDEEYYGELDAHQAEILEAYNKTMLYDRNAGMADCAEKMLKENKSTFFMVGLAHFIGEDGIVELLKSKGYKVEQI